MKVQEYVDRQYLRRNHVSFQGQLQRLLEDVQNRCNLFLCLKTNTFVNQQQYKLCLLGGTYWESENDQL